jgi:hypothetical protein
MLRTGMATDITFAIIGTGLPFDELGPVAVPGALVPVQCSVEHDYAVYVEPAVWVHHRL